MLMYLNTMLMHCWYIMLKHLFNRHRIVVELFSTIMWCKHLSILGRIMSQLLLTWLAKPLPISLISTSRRIPRVVDFNALQVVDFNEVGSNFNNYVKSTSLHWYRRHCRDQRRPFPQDAEGTRWRIAEPSSTSSRGLPRGPAQTQYKK